MKPLELTILMTYTGDQQFHLLRNFALMQNVEYDVWTVGPRLAFFVPVVKFSL